jgi:hypothetical protein
MTVKWRECLQSRRFRRSPTESENKAWSILRDRQVLGLKFRRQHVIDGFIVDFYCAEKRLILETERFTTMQLPMHTIESGQIISLREGLGCFESGMKMSV